MVDTLDEFGDPITDLNGDVVQVEEDYNVYTQQSIIGEKQVVTDESLQKIVIGKYEQTVWELEKKWYRCQDKKKLVIDVIWGQLDDDTQAQMELAATYAKSRKDGNIVACFSQVTLGHL